jgi:hypothetical protein
MTDIETQIITLINTNPHLSDDLKKRYILALFMMETPQQEEYLKLIQGFTRRCGEVDSGIFILRKDEQEKLRVSFDEIKRDILKKIQNKNNPNQK